MDKATRDTKFAMIKKHFTDADSARYQQGKMPLGSTEKGFWGTAHLDDVYEFCKLIELDSKRGFLDLGSGDGRVVLVASLFTHALGIEYDAKLHTIAEDAKRVLDLPDATFTCGDYTEHDLAPHQVWFSYADHNFEWLKKKRPELREGNVLYLYHDTYHPDFLMKGKIIWIGQIPLFSYTNERSSHGKS